MILKSAALFIGLFGVLFGTAAAEEPVLLDRVVAVVNQDVITWSELYKNMDTDASPQLRELKDEERVKIYKESEESFLETIINVKLQLQEAKSLGLHVGDDEVKEAIESIKKKYSMTDDSFQDSLKKEGYTLTDYRKRLKEQILIGKVVNQQVRSKVFVTPEEVEKFIRQDRRDSEGFRISQIFFKKPENAADKSKVEEKASAVLKKLNGGEGFRELAKSYSEDPSRVDGGDLGFIKKENLLREFTEAVSNLKPGEVSAPFWSERGLHIIKLEEKKEKKSTGEMKDEAEKIVSEKIFTERYNAWVKSLREKSFIEIRL